VGKASSAKKVARLAKQQGKRRVRTTQGKVFPIAIGVVLVLGFSLIFYARTSYSAGGPPRINLEGQPGDHWHAAYGVYTCDQFQPAVADDGDDSSGIHTHGDGAIHIHPFTEAASGKNARLGDFLDEVGISLSNSELQLPTGEEWIEGETTCADGEDGVLKVAVWEDAAGSAAPSVYLADFRDIRFTNNFMAFTIAFVPEDTDMSGLKPPSAANLGELAAADTDAGVETSLPGAPTSPTASTVAGATTTVATSTSSAATTTGATTTTAG
jgi:hypothetical protein